MESKLPEGYVTREAAAKTLEISLPTLDSLVRRGVLQKRRLEGTHQVFFREEDLQLARSAKTERLPSVQEVKVIALAALSAANRTETRMNELYARLGMDIVPLQRDPDSILALRRSARDAVTVDNVRSRDWVTFWTGCFFAIDEVYLRLAETLAGEDEPWKVYLDFATRIADLYQIEHPKHLHGLYQTFEASRGHLRYVSYLYCREAYGAGTATKVFGRKVTAVEELEALLR